jgi:catechol 2,3-dioxygenase-like lactoylglutathione lyase family enzyme
MLQDFFHVVVQAPSVGAMTDAYTKTLGYQVVEHGPLPADLAHAWGAAAMEGRASALLRPASGVESWIRFVEGDAGPELGVLGWNGIELLVENLDQIEARIAGSPFRVFSPPQTLSFSSKVRFMQVIGPSGELLFLNEMGDPSLGVGRALSPVDRPFVLTCGTLKVAETLDWFRRTLGAEAADPFPVVMPALNRIFGFADGSKHALGMVRMAGPCILELDEYPFSAQRKPNPKDSLPAGVSLVSCSAELVSPIADALKLKTIRIDAAPYNGAETLLLETPEGALLEIVRRKSGLLGQIASAA